MPRPAHRTRSKAKVYVRTPGGRTVIHYRRRRKGRARCAMCGKPLHGTVVSFEARWLPLTAKRPERPYGGYVCASCLSKGIAEAVRGLYG